MKSRGNRKAFSLIELLIVIAIIGVLSAFAVSAYRVYTIRANFSILFKRVDALVDQSILFAATNGRFGNCHDIGVNTGPDTSGGLSCDASQQDSQNLSKVGSSFLLVPNGSTFTIGEVSSPPCGKKGKFQFYQQAATTELLPAGVGDSISLFCYYWNYQNTIKKECSYQYYLNGNPGTDNLAPGTGWVNTDGTNGPSNPTYNNATCN